jgi:hypothetical protein
MGGMNWKRPTAIKGTMHHAKPSFSKETFAGAITSVVQYLAPLRYIFACVHCGQALDNPSLPLTSGMQLADYAKPRLNAALQR